MDLFGTKFCVQLGAWKLRFVLMLEDDEVPPAPHVAQRPPHHVTAQNSLGGPARHI